MILHLSIVGGPEGDAQKLYPGIKHAQPAINRPDGSHIEESINGEMKVEVCPHFAKGVRIERERVPG